MIKWRQKPGRGGGETGRRKGDEKRGGKFSFVFSSLEFTLTSALIHWLLNKGNASVFDVREWGSSECDYGGVLSVIVDGGKSD